jgi:hypothetical protein
LLYSIDKSKKVALPPELSVLTGSKAKGAATNKNITQNEDDDNLISTKSC